MELLTTASGRRCLELGSRLGRLGAVAIGAEGEGAAWMLARCAGCGASLAGGRAVFHDGTTPAAGVWLAGHYGFPAAVYFLERESGAAIRLTDGRGRVLTEETLPPASDWAGTAGSWDRLAGTDSAYAAQVVDGRQAAGVRVTVMDLPGQRPLRLALERLGCEVLSRPRPGVPLLRADELGLVLLVREGTLSLRPAGPDAVTAAVEWCLDRAESTLAVPAFGGDGGGPV